MAICGKVSSCKFLEQFIMGNKDLREIWFSRYCSEARGDKCEYKKLLERSNKYNCKKN
ncbi:MAG: hypothetical protein PWP71_2383 [Clostridia bacterium]|jgi:hypothetical protein|nr:hypothetical protein [Clostridia bacterium]